ncbi:MAG: hypothetical protein GY791_08390 [Alphaproteobacteria bacterium]|nr:hypothetical protein [Alphaproteobacteria bacterium]
MRLFPVSLVLLLAACGGPEERRIECSLLILDERIVVGARNRVVHHRVEGVCTNQIAPDMSHVGQR